MVKNFLRAFRTQLAAGGVTGGAQLILAVSMKGGRSIYTRVGAGRKHCPCCGWEGANFLPYIDEGYVTFQAECPVCRSQARHRGHYLFYRKFLTGIVGDLLYVAPERNIQFFRDLGTLTVRTSEYLPTTPADFHYDLVDIDCADASWDYIICHRVIEHVPDDRRAMSELYRILKPGGVCVLSVPIERGRDKTVEYPEANPLESYHYYRYGNDFVSRIPEQFLVQAYDFRTLFDAQEFTTLGLSDDLVFVCRRPK